MMNNLEKDFRSIYSKFKLMLYDKALPDQNSSLEDGLTLQEVIYMEIIAALGDCTVSEFSRFSKLSGSNTAYRLRQLEKKGYINRTQGTMDRREYHIQATEKLRKDYGDISDYISLVCDRIEKRFPEEDAEKLQQMLHVISEELMPEAGSSLRSR